MNKIPLNETGQSRRTFIKNGLIVCIGTGGVLSIKSSGFADTDANKRWGMIIDMNRCIGCQSCTVACKLQNNTIEDKFSTSVIEEEIGEYPASRYSFTPVQCNHCEEPPCVSACPENATFKLANGIVVTDWSKCIGEGSCVEACPYGARFLDVRFDNKADKCDFCMNRVEKGLEPACVESCASKARIWGDFNNPSGEFAEYIKSEGLTVRSPKLGIRTSILYKTAYKEPA
ncbi:MAG: 4Fe-4S dicluster domain-containing protein [Desulfobacteraceae bacterium]|jgi:Fe-S-cluster-containing dehydrogenase component